MLIIYAHKADPKAVIPEIAYGKTSACFDITCIKDTLIPAKSSAVVPNGLNLVIDQSEKYWMQVQLRSSKGFKHELVPHYGCIDAGYTGDLGIKIYNLDEYNITIKEGERYAQIAVFEKPDYVIEEISTEDFEKLKSRQQRGDGGFGSSGK